MGRKAKITGKFQLISEAAHSLSFPFSAPSIHNPFLTRVFLDSPVLKPLGEHRRQIALPFRVWAEKGDSVAPCWRLRGDGVHRSQHGYGCPGREQRVSAQKSGLARAIQFSSAIQSCPTLWDPVNCSTPGLPVQHQLLEPTQTHVH